MQLILASQSPYRKKQLEQMGLAFTAIKPEVDEEELKTTGPVDPHELTRYLASHKANSLRTRFPQAVILGSDQLVELNGRRLDKPGTRARAIEQLTALQGHAHRLITSLVMASPTRVQTFTDVTTITLRSLTSAEVLAYVELDQPLDCAGSYKIEQAGMALVERLESRDPSAIQGLPLLSLSEGFLKLGISWSELCRKGEQAK